MADVLLVTLQDGSIPIDEKVFRSLLDLSAIKSRKPYQRALANKSIPFAELKDLALKADVPYPLFFAPMSKVSEQLKDFNKQLYDRIPSKAEMKLHSRGRLDVSDIKLLLKDLSRKQGFFGKRVVTGAPQNKFVGLIAADVKAKKNTAFLAKKLRDHLDIDLTELRKKPKNKVVMYLTEKLELHNILVSFSSHNYMPQTLTGVEMSGICLKDKKFPFIFINTKDGEANPKIIEPAGRQTFTLVAMLVSIAMNKFMFSSKTKGSKAAYLKVVYAVVGEFLIPKEDIIGETVKNLEDLKLLSNRFKVTPSMCLFRLRELNMISKALADELKKKLADEINKKTIQPKPPKPENAYAKYNGERFSTEVLRAERAGTISSEEMRNVLFRKGKKMDGNLLRDYKKRFRV